MVKLRSMQWMFAVAALMLAAAPAAWAASANNNDAVTVRVDPVLGIDDETGDFTLVFDSTTGSAAGDTSTGQTVTYNVRSNTMPNTALAGAVSAKISSAYTDVALHAFPADYINDGTASNATLNKVGTDIVVGTTATAIYDKPTSVGTAGKILKGRCPVHYRGVATADLVPNAGETRTLTVTLKDA